MKDQLWLRTGCGTALTSLFALGGIADAGAQTPPRRIPPQVATPAPAPAEQADTETAETVAPTPAPAPRPVRRIAPVVTGPAPAPARTVPPVQRIRQAPVATGAPTPAPSAVAPRRRPPVITTPAAASAEAPDNSQIRRVPPAVATPPLPSPAGPVRPRRAPPVITSPEPDLPEPPSGEIRRRPPVIATPETGGQQDTIRRRPVITNPASDDGPRRPPVGVRDEGAMPSLPVAAQPERRPLSPMRPRPGPLSGELATEIVPPADAQTLPLAGSVTLQRGGFGDLMRTLPLTREISAAQLRANPTIRIGKSQLDFRKMLDNPMALVNVANRLGNLSDLVDVQPAKLTAFEVRNGVVVRDILSYSFKRGACSTESNRARIAAAGVMCFTRSSPNDIDNGYARPGDIRYIRDPARRNQALADARARRAAVGQDIDRRVAEFRARLADPAMRAELVSSIGEPEIARLAALDDTALAGELINSNENVIEQVFYVPTDAPPQEPATPAPPPAPKVEDVTASYPLGTHVFLAGFTLGRDFEWSQSVQTTIKWCLFGCKETYFAKVSAGFGYDFGLRFPVQLTGTYDYRLKDGAGSASVTTNVATIDGSATDYLSAKLPGELVFGGKELVASFSAHAGLAAKLPLVGRLGPIDIPLVDYDLTTLLPGDFANGQFKPPEPGKPGPSEPFILDQLDLLGGRGNFGVLGAQVFPAVDVRMDATALSLTLTDRMDGNRQTILPAGPATVPLALKNGAAEFVIGKPQYGIQFTLTPGLNARLFIDLAVWGAKVDWPVWFPQLAVKVPSDGLKFECHAATACEQEFRFTPGGAQSVFLGRIEQWGRDFDALWLPRCIDDICRFGVKLARNTVLFEGKGMDADNPGGDTNTLYQSMNPIFVEAFKRAKIYVADAQARKSQDVSNAMGIFAQAVWTKRCLDSLCFDAIAALAMQMGPRAAEIGKATPELGTLKINQQVNKEFVPKFQNEIDDSTLRQSMAEAALAARQAKRGRQPKPVR